MGWALPDVSLNDLLKLIRGFVDILILASGYQSSGLYANWDSKNIIKAFQWGFFFESVCGRLKSVDNFNDSVEELDTALSELTSNPYFPKGLSHLSFVSLIRAREFVFEHLIHTLPLRDAHLRAFMNAVVKMDFDEYCGVEDCLHVYHAKLKLLNEGENQRTEQSEKGFMEASLISSSAKNVFSKLIIRELLKRRLAVSSILSLEACLDILSNMIRPNDLSIEDWKSSIESTRSDQLIEYATWSNWMSKSFSYFFDKRTLRLVSGASMIFSAPKIQWISVFQRMNSLKTSGKNSSECIELLLFGCIASRWSEMVKYCVALSFESISISRIFCELCSMLIGSSNSLHCKEDTVISKENSILEYLVQFLGGQLHPLLELSPLLVAVAIPIWSPLFRLYLCEIDLQFKGKASTIRCCNCTLEMEHRECEVAERIWWLYAFHVRTSQLMHSTTGV